MLLCKLEKIQKNKNKINWIQKKQQGWEVQVWERKQPFVPRRHIHYAQIL